MLAALLCCTALVATALAGGNTGPVPPHLRACGTIAVNASLNCPRKRVECSDAWEIKYKTVDGVYVKVECKDDNAFLAVDKQIVDKIHCHQKEWHAEGEDSDETTTSMVCAKYCDADACSSGLDNAPRQYRDLHVHDSNSRHACAIAKCRYGFVALARDGTVLDELPSDTVVTCGGDGKWNTSPLFARPKKYRHLMCKRKPNPCEFDCDDEPWSFPYLNATSAAKRNGCKFSCPAPQVLSTPTKDNFAVTITCATCTRKGFLIDNDKIADQIGCSTCDVADGPVKTTDKVPGNKPATSTSCVLTCPKGMRLRYGTSDKLIEAKYAPGAILYRQFNPDGNRWQTNNGTALALGSWVACAKPTDCGH